MGNNLKEKNQDEVSQWGVFHYELPKWLQFSLILILQLCKSSEGIDTILLKEILSVVLMMVMESADFNVLSQNLT